MASLETTLTEISSGFNPAKYEDGTNLLAGTEFRDDGVRTTDWYVPAASKATLKWEEKWSSLRSRFERLVDQCRPIECVLIQSRTPAHARDKVGRPPGLE